MSQELFNLLHQEYGITPLESEMAEIKRVVGAGHVAECNRLRARIVELECPGRTQPATDETINLRRRLRCMTGAHESMFGCWESRVAKHKKAEKRIKELEAELRRLSDLVGPVDAALIERMLGGTND